MDELEYRIFFSVLGSLLVIVCLFEIFIDERKTWLAQMLVTFGFLTALVFFYLSGLFEKIT